MSAEKEEERDGGKDGDGAVHMTTLRHSHAPANASRELRIHGLTDRAAAGAKSPAGLDVQSMNVRKQSLHDLAVTYMSVFPCSKSRRKCKSLKSVQLGRIEIVSKNTGMQDSA